MSLANQIKLNVDAVIFDNSIGIGIGLIIQNHDEQVVAAFFPNDLLICSIPNHRVHDY